MSDQLVSEGKEHRLPSQVVPEDVEGRRPGQQTALPHPPLGERNGSVVETSQDLAVSVIRKL
jgi:hypothetical protein